MCHLAALWHIYGGGFHFNCCIIGADGTIWFNDGQTTGSISTREGSLKHMTDLKCLMHFGEEPNKKTAVLAIYSRK
jgi:hypothetical protein